MAKPTTNRQHCIAWECRRRPNPPPVLHRWLSPPHRRQRCIGGQSPPPTTSAAQPGIVKGSRARRRHFTSGTPCMLPCHRAAAFVGAAAAAGAAACACAARAIEHLWERRSSSEVHLCGSTNFFKLHVACASHLLHTPAQTEAAQRGALLCPPPTPTRAARKGGPYFVYHHLPPAQRERGALLDPPPPFNCAAQPWAAQVAKGCVTYGTIACVHCLHAVVHMHAQLCMCAFAHTCLHASYVRVFVQM